MMLIARLNGASITLEIDTKLQVMLGSGGKKDTQLKSTAFLETLGIGTKMQQFKYIITGIIRAFLLVVLMPLIFTASIIDILAVMGGAPFGMRGEAILDWIFEIRIK